MQTALSGLAVPTRGHKRDGSGTGVIGATAAAEELGYRLVLLGDQADFMRDQSKLGVGLKAEDHLEYSMGR
ncbi:hypothetical protein NDU88_003994 [Pleurodeles waltl]|uniref:Uncharacterized protein n=1 Tax=Pleurodeles waltl TaxID=8319 RepID=A0AAV7W6K1_PLEWA|nr:hypothetical protein NDU88_003994 [Pleurodeles waltl]